MRPPEPSNVEKEEVQIVETKSEMKNNSSLDYDDLESIDDYEEKTIYVRTRKVGYLIGTSGRTIRGFETNSGAKIDILKPNSCADETPILLSGTSESVRNVLRMIIDLYHMNNLSSNLWQHLRQNFGNDAAEDEQEDGKSKIYGHEEIIVRSSFAIFLQKMIPQFESEAKVHLEVGKECDDNPGVIPIGVIGTASQNYKALKRIRELYEKFLKHPVSDDVVEKKNNDNRLDPFSNSDRYKSIRTRTSGCESPANIEDYKETVILEKMPDVYAYSILQPICKLNSVLMEMSKEDDGGIKVSITGPEINVKRAKLQLQHSIS